MDKIDAFAHILPPKFYGEMLDIDPDLPDKMPFIKNQVMLDVNERRKHMTKGVKQIISLANANPEDYVDPYYAARMCRDVNDELTKTVEDNPDLFYGAVAAVPMNNISEAVKIINEQVAKNEHLLGIQLFTRMLGRSIADEQYRPVLNAINNHRLIIWLHPVFDNRKPDNNLVFSWEYELSQAMQDIVLGGVYDKFPNLKILVHHAGAMVPFFAGRIKYILGEEKLKQFKKFYVDTAILGNPEALHLAIDFFGLKHVIFGTDAPLDIAPAGATDVILDAINQLDISDEDKQAILSQNIDDFIHHKKLD